MKMILLALGLAVASYGQADGQGNLHWVGSWASAQQVPESANSLAPEDLHDATLRQIVHLSVGGEMLRVRLSNAFGTTPLHVSSAHIARPGAVASSRIDTTTDTPLTFAGHADVTIPAGAAFLSDAVRFHADGLSSVAVTMHLDDAPAQQTGHPGSRATSYLTHGAAVSAEELPDAKKFEHWTMLSGVDVAAGAKAYSVVALGDSITDGHGAKTDGNQRWTDYLASRLQASKETQGIGVLNVGIGGNHLLTDGLGPNALARFDRDVLAQAGVKYVLVLEGVNDLGALAREKETTSMQHEALVAAIEGAYEQIVERAHVHGLKVIGGTITPYVGSEYYHPAAADEADRQKVNAWIRTPSHFDAFVDFDKAMADAQAPDRLLPAYDSGDHLHPSPAGYKAMAAAIPLSFVK